MTHEGLDPRELESVSPRTGNLALRTAEFDDVDQLDALHGHPRWLRPVFVDPSFGPGSFTVVVDGNRVVSSACLQQLTVAVDGLEVPGGQPEWIGTLAEYRNRGLVRAQLDELHRRSAERGDLVQVIGGIDYFYRQFGYAYAISVAPWRRLDPATTVPATSGWTVRPAVPADARAIEAAESTRRSAARLTLYGPSPWPRRLAAGRYHLVVAERAGEVFGVASVERPDHLGGAVRLELLCATEGAAYWALIDHVRDQGQAVVIEAHPHVAPFIDTVATAYEDRPGLYVRVPDPGALLERLAPVLGRRLAASEFADATGKLRISTYRSVIDIDYDHGEVGSVAQSGHPENPDGRLPAVPPDHLAELIFGRWGASALAERYDDVTLASEGPLMDVLFPMLVADAT
jgi:hypothetical protein